MILVIPVEPRWFYYYFEMKKIHGSYRMKQQQQEQQPQHPQPQQEQQHQQHQRYILFRGFLSPHEQLELAKEVLDCHDTFHKNNPPFDWTHLDESTASQKLSLGISCGASLESTLPLAVQVSRRLFSMTATRINIPTTTNLTGLALLYGPKGTMLPHYDAPTQPGQQEEWLCMMTMGANVDFVLDDVVVTMQSGDCLVMDSMAIQHGVKCIAPSTIIHQNQDAELSIRNILPVKGSRLGILLWQGRTVLPVPKDSHQLEAQIEGMDSLFGEE